jgi:hypothetical protein
VPVGSPRIYGGDTVESRERERERERERGFCGALVPRRESSSRSATSGGLLMRRRRAGTPLKRRDERGDWGHRRGGGHVYGISYLGNVDDRKTRG